MFGHFPDNYYLGRKMPLIIPSMISKEKEQRLISIYFFVCDLYEKELFQTCHRFSNNANPEFTDQEIMTIYLFTGREQRDFSIKEIHSFAKDYLVRMVSQVTRLQSLLCKIKSA